MRFLNTWTGEFEWHDPKTVRYAILSHVWRTPDEGGEQSFDDVRSIQAAVNAARNKPDGCCMIDWPSFHHCDDVSPSDNLHTPILDGVSIIFSAESPLSTKIKGLCGVARSAGFRLVWNDACCIDKSSSAELSEAINSMFEWYRLSDMCYVYLADVPHGDIPQAQDSCFWKSKWHRRGWTLQELIAPERIEFLTRSWTFLGTKLGLAVTLSDVITVDVDILTGRAPVHSASVAQRMSWAARRETTRVEDRAYSLMGLFDIHMPPIYGEGENAFLRLQEEIIRTIPDQSIFAFRKQHIMHPPGLPEDPFPERPCPALLAPSPSYFLDSTIRPVGPVEFATLLRLEWAENVPPLDCVFTPRGASMQLLCVDLTELPMLGALSIPPGSQNPCQDCVQRGDPDLLALLQCEDAEGRLAALPLHPSSAPMASGRGSPVGTFIQCYPCDCHYSRRPLHTLLLPRDTLAIILDLVQAQTIEVSILRCYSDPPKSKLLKSFDQSSPRLNHLWPGPDCTGEVAFALAPRSVTGLRALEFTTSPLQIARRERQITLETTLMLRDKQSRRPLHSIHLTVSLERLAFWDTNFRFSIVNSYSEFPEHPPSSPGASTSSTVATNDEEVQEVSTLHAEYWPASISADFLLPSRPERPNWIRLLRLSLERPADSEPRDSRTVWLTMEMSAEYERVQKAEHVWNTSGLAETRMGVTERASVYGEIACLWQRMRVTPMTLRVSLNN